MKSLILLASAMLLLSQNAQAQLSPGDLVEAHAHLEGLLSCTKCHDLGKGVSDSKCLDCHEFLKARIDEKLGYHTSSEVKNETCISCHSDHHGREFDIIRFDEQAFDHDLTGYHLEGAHTTQDCAACHTSTHIQDPIIKDRKYTFLGLEETCTLCHQDAHQGTLSTDCAGCHDIDAFEPASLFNHSNTDFALLGKHLEVECESCHPISTRKNQRFQEFAGIEFSNCTDCHEDIHNNQFGQNCQECHSEASWHIFKGMNDFDHDRTGFPLAGNHRSTDCFACHADGTNNGDPFQEYVDWDAFACAKCHEDVHDKKLGRECTSCHSERSFTRLVDNHTFDHKNTDYALEGKHQEVECKACHTAQNKLDPIAFEYCTTCHEDFHEGAFVRDDRNPDCAECHDVHDFTLTTFGIAEHNKGVFPLEGAHMATPCFSCHVKEEKWHFKELGHECTDCHKDVHEGILPDKYYPENACTHCHVTDQWAAVTFDHNQTEFALEGKHLQIKCNDCHLVHGINNQYQQFTDLSFECSHCHEDKHRGQFSVSNKTDCNRCHAFDSWEATLFNHSSTSFPLEGEHINVACDQCHKQEEKDGSTYTLYLMEDFACASCHL